MRQGFYKRKDGRWEGYIVYNDPDTGEECKKSFYGRGKYGQDVKQKMREFIRKIEAGDYSDIKKVTLEGWLKKFMEVYCKKLEVTTKEGYQNYIDNHINPYMGKLLLKDIKPLHITKFYNHERCVPRVRMYKKDGKMVPVIKDGKPVPLIKNGEQVIGFSEKTILQEHRILHNAFERAVGDGLMSKNPCSGADAPTPEDYEPTIYSEKEYNLLLEKLKGHRMEAIILIAGMCGLRRAELLGLTWENIDLSREIITIQKTLVPTKSEGNLTKDPKTRKSARTFTIPSDIIPRLKELRGIGKLYARLNGEDYNPGSVSREFKKLLENNGLKHIRLHDLRHFNATMMLKYGVSERGAQERLGHSNPGQTKKYQHILKEMDKRSADKLNNVLAK